MKFFQLERFVFLFQTTWWSHGNCPFVISYAYMCTCTRLFPRVGSCQRSWWELHKSDATPNRVQWGIPRWSPNQILTSPYLILLENSFDKIYHNTENFVLLKEKPCLSFTSRKIKELRNWKSRRRVKNNTPSRRETKGYPVKKKTDKLLKQFLGRRPVLVWLTSCFPGFWRRPPS